MLTLQALVDIEGDDRTAGLFGTMPLEPWHPGKDAKPDRIVQLNCGGGAPMQVVKKLEHERTSTTEEQKWSSFQTNYDQQLITPRVLQKGLSW